MSGWSQGSFWSGSSKYLEDAGTSFNPFKSDSALAEYFKPNFKIRGIGGVGFDIYGTYSLIMPSAITDNYVETNDAYQDQVSNMPRILRIEGDVGELVIYREPEDQSYQDYYLSKLTQITSFVPSFSNGVQNAKKSVLTATNVVNMATEAVSRVAKLLSGVSYQQKIYVYLSYLRRRRHYEYKGADRDDIKTVQVRTPWGTMSRMMIKNIEISQSAESEDKTHIVVELQDWKTVGLQKTTFSKSKYALSSGAQNATKQKLGSIFVK